MKVRALTSFTDESGAHEPGDEFEMADNLAVIRMQAFLVARVAEEPRTATKPEPEKAVRSKRGRPVSRKRGR